MFAFPLAQDIRYSIALATAQHAAQCTEARSKHRQNHPHHQNRQGRGGHAGGDGEPQQREENEVNEPTALDLGDRLLQGIKRSIPVPIQIGIKF